jgi:hypothetical protein
MTERTSYRWRCWLCRRRPSCGGRPGLAHPRTRGGPTNVQQSCPQTARALLVAHCAGFAHCTCTCQPPERGAWKPLDNRTMRTVSRRRRECQLYVLSLRTSRGKKENLPYCYGLFICCDVFRASNMPCDIMTSYDVHTRERF